MQKQEISFFSRINRYKGGEIILYKNEFINHWDIDVFKSLARASVRATAEARAKAMKTSIKVQAWISYKDVWEREKPCNGQLGFGMSVDNLVRLGYFNRKGNSCNLTDKGLERYNELLGA